MGVSDDTESQSRLEYDGMSNQLHHEALEVPAEAIDELGHVNNRTYLTWMEALARRHAAVLEAGSEPSVWVVREHQVSYLKPAFQGEEVHAYTWIEDPRGVSVRRRYVFLRRGELLVSASTRWVCVDKETMRPRRIPAGTAAAVMAGPVTGRDGEDLSAPFERPSMI